MASRAEDRHHQRAGVCISASAERNGLRLIAVVLGRIPAKSVLPPPQPWLDYGFANYENVTPQMSVDAPEAISVSHGTADKVELIFTARRRAFDAKNAAEPLTSTIELPLEAGAPVAQGAHLGTVQLSSGGEVLASFPSAPHRTWTH